MAIKKRYFLALLALIPLFIPAREDSFEPIPTDFSYSEERLSTLRSPQLITLDRIDKWEEPLQHYFAENGISEGLKAHFYTYLYAAQKEAAFLSYNVQHFFVGSLDPLTRCVVGAFFPEFTAFPECVSDPYSELLAEEVWGRFSNGVALTTGGTEDARLRENRAIRENGVPLGRALFVRAQVMQGEEIETFSPAPRHCPYSGDLRRE